MVSVLSNTAQDYLAMHADDDEYLDDLDDMLDEVDPLRLRDTPL